MTTDERVQILHARMDALRRRRERHRTAALSATGVVLAVCLILLVFSGGGVGFPPVSAPYSGSTMLLDNAGGYVLVAMIAFFLGVVVTTAIRRHLGSDAAEKDGERHGAEDTIQ